MPEYAVGLDRLYRITAGSPDAAEAELARRLNAGDIDVQADECVAQGILDGGVLDP